MSLKTVAAIIVASLVAGVVLGSMGIAGAGTGSQKLPGAMAPAPAGLMDDCGSCEMEAGTSPADCGSCTTDTATPAGSAAPAGAAGGCPGTAAGTGSGSGACDGGSCPQ